MAFISRRDFTKKSAISLAAIPFIGSPCSILEAEIKQHFIPLNISIFSKHLQFLDYQALGEQAVTMGFNGVDLTVRPNGHVEPESVINDLPKAIELIKKGGSTCQMITTAINSADNKLDENVLKTASKYGVKYYRSNWFKYSENQSMEQDLEVYQQNIKSLSTLNSELGIIGCYQNHAGTSIGSSIWEIKKLLEFANIDSFGVQYDIRHAQVEGGLSWENGLKLIQKNIKTIVVKDFKWGQVNGVWKPINVPIGEGMVDFDRYFKLLKKYQIQVPVSLHCEYDLGGAERGNKILSKDKNEVYNAISKDLKTIQNLWEMA
jgi:sugar phosphate isomerase/epimerase